MEIPLQTYLMITWLATKIIIWIVYCSIYNSKYSDKCTIISWGQMQEVYKCHYYTAYNMKVQLPKKIFIWFLHLIMYGRLAFLPNYLLKAELIVFPKGYVTIQLVLRKRFQGVNE